MLGRIGLRLGAPTAQRRATTGVLSIASGRSANSAAHRRGGFIQASGEESDAVVAVDLARLGDAQHGVVGGVESGVGISRPDWSRRAAGRAHRRARSAPLRPLPRPDRRAGELDIEPAREQGLRAGRA